MKTIRVLVVDDHAMVRAGLRALLEAEGDIQVIGEAENGQQAVGAAARLRPDVVLLDLAMPRLNGMEAARQIAHEVPTTRVLILSSYSDPLHVRQTASGGAYFSPPLLNHLLREWRERRSADLETTPRAPALSWRHAEVLQLIAEGYCTKQIAAMLFISLKTAERHRYGLMKKLKMHKVATLTRYAVSSGIVESNRAPGWPSTPAQTHPQKSGRPALMM
jgi:DNA-binding NarL/FixJ family response regulator